MPTTAPVNDPLFGAEWYIQNTGQAGGGPGIDLDVVPVWANYTGAGVKVAVVDDGVQLNHPDLAANIDVADSYDAVSDTKGSGAGNPKVTTDSHGTAVAGIIGAVGNNSIGTVGVAYGATLSAYRIFLTADDTPGGDAAPTSGSDVARAFQAQLKAGVDVSNNSWGLTEAFAVDWTTPNAASLAVTALGSNGRKGLGTPIVFAAGNDRGIQADAMLDNYRNSRYSITVAALSNNGTAGSYSTMGADILVSAFGGGNDPGQVATAPGNAIATSDRTGVLGYNTQSGTAGDAVYSMNGTSAAAPMVSGVVALMLQAQPGLGYRDVQSILAYSARLNDPRSEGIVFNQAGNADGGGLHYSRQYGFGQVDARAAVRLAETWQYVSGVAHTDSNLQTVAATVADGAPAAGTALGTKGLSIGFDVSAAVVTGRIELALDLTDLNPSSLVVKLTSAKGTELNLVDNPGNVLDRSGLQNATPTVTVTAWPGVFTLDSPAFLNELAEGHWTLTISDNGKTGAAFNSAQLTILGDAPTAAQTYYFNDDFGLITGGAPAQLNDYGLVGATSRLDAAAASGAVTFDLSGKQASTVQGQTINFTQGARFDQIIGGDGNDTLIGDGRGELIYGGRGSNVIDGGVAAPGVAAGASTAAYLRGRGDYTVAASSGAYSVKDDTAVGQIDQLSHIGKMQFLEGTLYAPGATDTAIEAAALYQGLLGRAPDAAGFHFWTTSGTDFSALAQDFVTSAEFQQGFGTVSNDDFVNDLYQNLLGRSADSTGHDYWTADLQKGISRGDVAAAFGGTAEFKAVEMTHLFTAINSVGNIWGV